MYMHIIHLSLSLSLSLYVYIYIHIYNMYVMFIAGIIVLVQCRGLVLQRLQLPRGVHVAAADEGPVPAVLRRRGNFLAPADCNHCN